MREIVVTLSVPEKALRRAAAKCEALRREHNARAGDTSPEAKAHRARLLPLLRDASLERSDLRRKVNPQLAAGEVEPEEPRSVVVEAGVRALSDVALRREI